MSTNLILPGNFSDYPDHPKGIENLFPGFAVYVWRGFAEISTTAAAAWGLRDVNGDAAIIAASSTDPVYTFGCSFTLPVGLVADQAGRTVKLGTVATTAAGSYMAESAVSGSSPFAYAAAGYRSASTPTSFNAATANVTWQLFSTDGANAAAGTIAAAAGAIGGVVAVPCEVIYAKRKPAVTVEDINRRIALQRTLAGVS